MPRIERLRPVLLSAPYGHAWSTEKTTRLPSGFRHCSMVELTLSGGATGIGEGYIGVFAPKVFTAIAELVSEVIVGRDLADADAIIRDVTLATSYWSAQGAARHVISAIEIALWDLRSQLADRPLYELLSEQPAKPFVLYGSGGSVRHPADIAGELNQLSSLGIGTIKIRSRAHQSRHAGDIMALARARNIDVAIDMTQNLALPSQSVDDAIGFLDALSEAGHELPLFLEEPFGPDRIEDFARLRQRTDVPVAGGEIVTTPEEMRELIDRGSYDICQPDATVLGGIGPVLATGRFAKRKGVQTVVHAWGGAACLMSNYHCAFALGAGLAEYPIPPFPLRENLLAEPLVIADGRLQPPKAPGLGINLTTEIEREFIFREEATYKGIAIL
jgi:L-alanine-DL-glutamate epimerase-like enolase superfamily enzyme